MGEHQTWATPYRRMGTECRVIRGSTFGAWNVTMCASSASGPQAGELFRDPLSSEGAWAYTPTIRSDSRGSFLELFRGGEFLAALGYRLEVAQANCSVSRRGVIRGIH